MLVKRWIRNFFGFTRSQINAFMVLLPLMAILIFSEPMYRWFTVRQTRPDDSRALDSLIFLWNENQLKSPKSEPAESRISRPALFMFNPNTIALAKFEALGFSTTLATRVVKYRSKGGKFKIKKDLLRIYGMPPSLYQRIESFIDLPNEITKLEIASRDKTNTLQVSKVRPAFDLNLADTAQLKTVFGIGDKRALRIVAFRIKLGGFIALTQLNEIYTLDSVVIKNLKAASFITENYQPKQLMINQATEQDFSTHPYLSRSAARQIVAHRFQHGKFQSAEDLRKIHSLDAKIIEKITPYLNFETGH